MKIKLLIIFIICKALSFGQDSTINYFSYSTFIDIVKQHHPIAYQANLLIKKGQAYLTKSKGGFDPKLNGNLTQKYFDGKQYYSYFNSGLKIPTWFGISAQAGYTNTDGIYINPDRQTPQNGLWYGGLTVNLGQGLWIDKRRAELKQAKIYVNSTAIQQQLMLNQLIYDASIAYWNWVMAFNKVEVYKQSVIAANLRHLNIRQSVVMGDKAEVDTLKSLIALQNRQLMLEQSKLEYKNKTQWLETFLWQDGLIPLEIDSTQLKPYKYQDITINNPTLNILDDLDSIIDNHPQLQYYNYDIDMAKINYRLNKENLKPVVQLKYNALTTPVNPNSLGEYNMENYNWGAKIVYPIFTRKERGQLQLSEIEIKEKESNLSNKRAQIEYKIINAYNSIISTHQQILIYKDALLNYQQLFKTELIMFNIGESSLFLVNTREQQVIDAEIKLIKLIKAYQQSIAQLNYQMVRY